MPASDPNPHPDFSHMLVDAADAADAAATQTHSERDPIVHVPDLVSAPSPSDLLPSGEYLEPWTRQPDETDLAWSRFNWYRDQGPGRRRADFLQHFSLSVPTLDALMRKYNWTQRLVAFDQYEDRLYRLQREMAIREMAERHGTQTIEAIESLSVPFKAIAQRMQDDPDLVSDLSKRDFKELMRMAASAGRILPSLMSAERLARGMPTEVVEQTGEVRHVHEYSRDNIADILETLTRTGAFDAGSGPDEDPTIVDAEVIGEDTGENQA